MVKEISHKGKKYFQCDLCKFYYKTKTLAQECESFCNKYKSCSLEITKHSINIKKEVNKNGRKTKSENVL